MYLFIDPSNMVDHHGLCEDVQELVDLEGASGEQRNEVITFKVRLNIGRDLDIEMKEKDTIKQLKEHISGKLNNLDPTKIKVIAKGKMYQDSYLLSHPFPIKSGDLIQ